MQRRMNRMTQPSYFCILEVSPEQSIVHVPEIRPALEKLRSTGFDGNNLRRGIEADPMFMFMAPHQTRYYSHHLSPGQIIPDSPPFLFLRVTPKLTWTLLTPTSHPLIALEDSSFFATSALFLYTFFTEPRIRDILKRSFNLHNHILFLYFATRPVDNNNRPGL